MYKLKGPGEKNTTFPVKFFAGNGGHVTVCADNIMMMLRTADQIDKAYFWSIMLFVVACAFYAIFANPLVEGNHSVGQTE